MGALLIAKTEVELSNTACWVEILPMARTEAEISNTELYLEKEPTQILSIPISHLGQTNTELSKKMDPWSSKLDLFIEVPQPSLSIPNITP